MLKINFHVYKMGDNSIRVQYLGKTICSTAVATDMMDEVWAYINSQVSGEVSKDGRVLELKAGELINKALALAFGDPERRPDNKWAYDHWRHILVQVLQAHVQVLEAFYYTETEGRVYLDDTVR